MSSCSMLQIILSIFTVPQSKSQSDCVVLYRITNCKYSRIGCPWRGPFHEATEHEKVCVHPHRSGAEVMEALQVIDLKCEEEKRLYNCIFDLLSYEKITFNGMMLHDHHI